MTIEEFAASVQTRIAAVSGLAGSKVIWEMPGHSTAVSVPRPARPFLSLTILEDGNAETLPEESVIDNPDPEDPTENPSSGSPLSAALLEAIGGHPFTGIVQPPTPMKIRVLETGTFPQNGRTISISGTDADDAPISENLVRNSPEDNPLVTTQHFKTLDFCLAVFSNASGTAFVTLAQGPVLAPFPSQDPILLQTTDRPEITVRVTAYTDAPRTGAISPAFALLKKVRGKMGSELTADALDPITVLDRGNVTNASLVLETGYEGRAVLDLKFGSIETESEGVNTIETVKTKITIKNLDDSVIIEKTVTLPNS